MVEIKLTGVDGVMDMLKKLPPEIVSKRGGPVRAALRKGAMVIVRQARANFKSQVGRTDKSISAGFTAKQIVAKRRSPPVGVKGEKFVVTVNYVRHPSGNFLKRGRVPIRANDVAFIMEYGSKHMPARPWLRPAFAARKEEAVRVVESSMMTEINKAIKRYERKNANAAARR